jgi:hypothetical protein
MQLFLLSSQRFQLHTKNKRQKKNKKKTNGCSLDYEVSVVCVKPHKMRYVEVKNTHSRGETTNNCK